MSKISIYKKKDYCLSWGEDCVFIDLEMRITKETESFFSSEITNNQINKDSMAFASYLLPHLTSDGLARLDSEIKRLVKEETDSQLFTLFYVGEVTDEQPRNTNPSA